MQTFFRKWVITGVFPLFMLMMAGGVRASVTIEVAIGWLPITEGDVGILVVDREGLGFQTPQEGIQLTSGSPIGFDDLILAVFEAEGGDHWGVDKVGFSGIASAIDLDTLGIPVGAPLKFYWLPGKQRGDTTSQGETWYSFRNDSVGASGGTSGFLTPNEFGVHRISYLSDELGGDFDSGAPENNDDYGTGLHLTLVGNLMSQALSIDSLRLYWDENSGADSYRIYRSTTPDIGSATLIGTTTDLEYTDGDLPVGEFYYWVETVFTGDDSSVAALDTAASTVIAIPDVTVRAAVVRPRKTRVGKGYSFLTNAGPGDGSFRLRGSRGNSYTKITYFKRTGGRSNVTGKVYVGAYATNPLPNSSFEMFEVQAKPSPKYRRLVRSGKRITSRAKVYNSNLNATPAANAVGADAARIRFIRRP